MLGGSRITRRQSLLTLVCSAATSAKSSPAQEAEARFPIRLYRSFRDQPVPIWQNGFFAGIDNQNSPNLRVYAYAGNADLLFDTPLKLEDSVRTVAHGVAVSPAGMVAVAGSAYSASGLGASFLATLNHAGQIQRVVRLGKFALSQLCYAPDGTLWAAGGPILFPPGSEPPAGYDIIRAYGPDGQQRFSGLKRSSFSKESPRPNMLARMASNDRVVAFLSPHHNTLAGVSPEGKPLYVHSFTPPAPEYQVTGFAVSDQSDLYMSTQERDGQKELKAAYYFYRASERQWKRIAEYPMRAGFATALFGMRGTQMLVSNPFPNFAWIPKPA